MRLNDREIRAELRKEAMSVPIPDDMWANISRTLEREQAAKTAPVSRPVAVRVPMRHFLAVGVAAAVFWMVLIPSGAYVDRVHQPATPKASATGYPRWDIPTRSKDVPKEPQEPPQVESHRRHAIQAFPNSK